MSYYQMCSSKEACFRLGFSVNPLFLTDKRKKPDSFGNISLPNTWLCMDGNTMAEEDGWMDALGTTSKLAVQE